MFVLLLFKTKITKRCSKKKSGCQDFKSFFFLPNFLCCCLEFSKVIKYFYFTFLKSLTQYHSPNDPKTTKKSINQIMLKVLRSFLLIREFLIMEG